MSSEKEECICAEDQGKIPAGKAVDYIVPREGRMVLGARYNKDCPIHGYEVVWDEEKEE